MIPRAAATHRCKICGSRWRRWDDFAGFTGGWSLYRGTVAADTYPYGAAGKCCDNEPMGAQIEPLPKPFVQPWYRVCVNCGEQRRDHAYVDEISDYRCLFSPTVFEEAK